MLLGVMVQVWNDDKMQAFVEEHWPFLVATLNDPVVRWLPHIQHSTVLEEGVNRFALGLVELTVELLELGVLHSGEMVY
jgi:hypothetical protein